MTNDEMKLWLDGYIAALTAVRERLGALPATTIAPSPSVSPMPPGYLTSPRSPAVYPSPPFTTCGGSSQHALRATSWN